MTRWYLDTSAAFKLIAEEPESAALAQAIDSFDGDLVACLLLETELRRAAWRTTAVTQDDVVDVLATVTLHELDPSTFTEAGLINGADLRSLDALHVAAAVRLGCDAIVTYDARMLRASATLGLATFSPA